MTDTSTAPTSPPSSASERRSGNERRGGRVPTRRPGWPELALVVGVVALVLLTFSSIRIVLVRYELSQRTEALRAEISTLEDENERLRRELDSARSDAGIERLARESLGWARPGESAVVIAGIATPSRSPSPVPRSDNSLWNSLWNRLFSG